MRWTLKRARPTAPPAAPAGQARSGDRPSYPSAAVPVPAVLQAPAPRTPSGWLALAPLRPTISRTAPVIAAPLLALPEVSGTRSLVHRKPQVVAVQAQPAGRVDALATVLAPFEEVTASPLPGEPAPRQGRPTRWVPSRSRPAQLPPLTLATERYVGEAQHPAEPYRAPGWLRAAATEQHLLGPDPSLAAAQEEDDDLPPLDFNTPGPLIASWTAPESMLPKELVDRPPAAPAAPVSKPRPGQRRRSLGESRRLGLGAPLRGPVHQAPGPAPVEAHATAAEVGEDGDGDGGGPSLEPPDDSEQNALLGHPPPSGPAPVAPAPSGPPYGASPDRGPLPEPQRPQLETAPPETSRRRRAAALVFRSVSRAVAPAVPSSPVELQVRVLADPPGVERVPPATAASIQASHHSDVSRVPVHRGSAVSAEAQALGTRAFARGGAVYIPAEEGPLDSPQAQALLRHELVHVVQRRGLGGVLPTKGSPQWRALESEARAAERTTDPAPLTLPPRAPQAPSPDDYVQQVTDELVRQGIARRDGAGNVVLGEELDRAESAPAPAQHYDEKDREADLETIKTKALAESRGKTELPIYTLPSDEQRQVTHELAAWKSVLKKTPLVWPQSEEWYAEQKLNSIQSFQGKIKPYPTSVPEITGPTLKRTTDSGEDVPVGAQIKKELDVQMREFRTLDITTGVKSDARSSSEVPRVPDVIGKDWLEAKGALESESDKAVRFWKGQHRGFTVVLEEMASIERKGFVLDVDPSPGETITAEVRTVTVLVSSGLSKDNAVGVVGRELWAGFAEMAAGLVGYKTAGHFRSEQRMPTADRERIELNRKEAEKLTAKALVAKAESDRMDIPLPDMDADTDEEEDTGEGSGKSPAVIPAPAATGPAKNTAARNAGPVGTASAAVKPGQAAVPAETAVSAPTVAFGSGSVPEVDSSPVPAGAAGAGPAPRSPGRLDATRKAVAKSVEDLGEVGQDALLTAAASAASAAAGTAAAKVSGPVGKKPAVPWKEPATLVRMPQVVGMMLMEAELALARDGIRYTVVRQPTLAPENLVIETDCDQGTVLGLKGDLQTGVTLTVSTGAKGQKVRASAAQLGIGVGEMISGVFGLKENLKLEDGESWKSWTRNALAASSSADGGGTGAPAASSMPTAGSGAAVAQAAPAVPEGLARLIRADTPEPAPAPAPTTEPALPVSGVTAAAFAPAHEFSIDSIHEDDINHLVARLFDPLMSRIKRQLTEERTRAGRSLDL
ncbi:PASTA domain-containing protein (plasmid) [Kitasatospora sp. NBC_00070]|uniref:eCIS core domain-containing protein n=1 Tax=Kitasatospora sp. NBC_00070 TaxID=2975962 RepID=UPI002F914F69